MPEAKDNKFDLLVNAAFSVIREKGFEKASVAQIVKEAGVAQGTFYLYFESKSALVPAIADRILNILFMKIKGEDQKSQSLHDTISSLVHVTFKVTKDYKELIELCYSGLAYYHGFDRWEEIYRPYYDWLENKLETAVEEGTLKTKVELSHLTRMIINLVEDTAETDYLSNKEEELIEESKRQVLLFLKSSLTDRHSF